MTANRAFSAVVVMVFLLLLAAGGSSLAQESGTGGSGTILAAVGTAFTYQGRLVDGSDPANGIYDFHFSLWDAASAGSQVGSTLSVDDQSLADGLFTVTLDFGSGAIDGGARWLEIEVKRDADSTYDILSPRVPLTPAPHALALPGLWTQQDATSPNLIGGYEGNSVTAGAHGAAIGGGGESGDLNLVTDDYGVVGGGRDNQAGDGLGTTADAAGATVGGGRSNTASDDYATVGGGFANTASGISAAVGGGSGNSASSGNSTIGGGMNNVASGGTSTVGGGGSNAASHNYTVVAGGYLNTASGYAAMVPGGRDNAAQGSYSLAAGRRAKANHDGAFVWADSTDADLSSTDADQFLVRAKGGVSLTVALGGLRLESATMSPNLIGGHRDNSVTAGVSGASIGGGGQAGTLANGVTNDYGVVGGGGNNLASYFATVGGGEGNTASGGHATVDGGYSNRANGAFATIGGGNGNDASGLASTVGGGATNYAGGQYAAVPGGRLNTAQGSYSLAGGRRAKANHDGAFVWADSTDADFASTANDQFLVRASGGVALNTTGGALRLEPNVSSPNLIGGYSGNSVTAGAYGATIGGGGFSGVANRVTDSFGVVGGGLDNQAGDGVGTPHDSRFATVSGGLSNTASGDVATVGGGKDNTASGWYAIVPGGYDNTAQGYYSFAAGRQARANHDGAFVWADSTAANFSSTAADQFLVRASGGVWFGTTSSPSFPEGSFIATSTGAYLSTGGAWTDSSDRDLKENLVPVDGQEVLARLAGMPISTWNYKAQDPDVRHMGPTAQDFSAAFGLGEDDRHIASLDANGVALAGIQALYAQNEAQAARLDALEEENAGLRQQLDMLEARLSALEAGDRTEARPHSPFGGFQPTWLLGGLLAVGCVVVAGRRVRVGGGS